MPGKSAKMPVASGGSQKKGDAAPGDPSSPSGGHKTAYATSWGELEAVKGRAAAAMDRVEFLASTRDKLTEFKANEANQTEIIMRTRSSPQLHLSSKLTKSRGEAAQVLETRMKLLETENTLQKRHKCLHRFVINKETEVVGNPGMQAAKTSARGTQPVKKPYPLYDELFNVRYHTPGTTRQAALMAVNCPSPYTVPEEALRHGMSMKSTGSLASMSKTH